MKHPRDVTTFIILLFLISQLIGVALISRGLETSIAEDGSINVTYEDTALGPRPETKGAASLIYLLVGIGIGTVVLLILAHYNQRFIWKAWFFIAVCITLTIALGTFIPTPYAAILAILLGIWKIFRPNTIIHNATEMLVYAGISILLVPLFNLLWASILLLAIAAYDAYAVWKSKHMISLAKFQTASNVFAGLHIAYDPHQEQKQKTTRVVSIKQKNTPPVNAPESRSAVLGGGDIAFPMLFTGTVIHWLVTLGYSKLESFVLSLALIAITTGSLAALLTAAKKDKYYPAMPFLAAGCFVGLALVALFVYA